MHPGVLDTYLDGSLLSYLEQYNKREKKEVGEGLRAEEARTLAYLHRLSASTSD
ncbi:MAG: hypothetical protein NVSMB27_32340 [Ktedonobacteraceae bacterium]